MSSINIEKLDKLAELSVSTGVGLQRGQNLLITAPSDASRLGLCSTTQDSDMQHAPCIMYGDMQYAT